MTVGDIMAIGVGLWRLWTSLTAPPSRVDSIQNVPGGEDATDWGVFWKTGAWVVPMFVLAVAALAVGRA